ncbi:hypothetical protein G6M26_27345 [Agrobacterium tumefaciens]|nr:hypothetical protein [Agrobacterium tumefaciens]NTE22271.1 hypothetical protein [Agrobacterium tumefaciens]
MEINATIQVNLENEKMLLVLIVNSIKEQCLLYEYLSESMEGVRGSMSFGDTRFQYVTVGYWRDYNVLDWEMNYISLIQ